jgi:hypothetical protein
MAAADDQPSRIDQVFADPRWVGEALTAAAADAIERHQRAGVPMVVFRDGRIEHVPAERLAPDVDALLKDVDFEAERSASETIAWFEERRSAINSCLMANKPALLHQGRFKRFHEELYPFALWLGHLYADREGVACFLKSSTSTLGDYDAVVKDCATDPATVTYVQLTTTTFDRDESLRMKRFLKGEVVPAYGPPDELEWVTQEEMLKDAFDKIEQRVQRKSRFSHGQGYVLVLCFDDFMWFGTDDDRAALTSFVTARLPEWALNVATLYIVGISGRTFLTFPIPSRPA